MKTNRHSKILDLINKYPITTQEELLHYLRIDGYDVTQSTVSRDIKFLRLHKSLDSDGKYRYQAPVSSEKGMKSNFENLFANSVITVDYAVNIVVIKTYSGMAQAVCASLDSMGYDSVVGTLAGEDTILVVCRSENDAREYSEIISRYIG